MSTPESNPSEKSISNFKGDAVNGNEIIGGGKSSPIIVMPDTQETPQGVTIPGVVLQMNPNSDFSLDGNVRLENDGNVDLK